ncbi:hypothetical protein Taro_003960 [Colocasia esculenta]|uniref:Uncharacterized protein n=1 Tax=Colocasia esculenta TaxID=4460 RepID=A0A843TN76_COLES|nr:hypothetical protein [Colocasia esculenta]
MFPRAGLPLGPSGGERGSVVLLCLPHLFARCLALEGLSRSEVVSVAWDPHPREPLRERSGLRVCSSWQPTGQTLELRGKRGLDSGAKLFVELSCLGLGRRGRLEFIPAQTRQSLVSLPCSTLVLEPRREVKHGAAAWPGCGVVCVVHSLAALSHSSGEVRGESWQAKRVLFVALACTAVIARPCLVFVGVVGLALCGPVLLVVSTRCPLGFIVPFLGASPWWHRRVWLPDLAVCLGSGVVLLVGPRPCEGLRWPCLRGSSSRELGVRRVVKAVGAPCVVSSTVGFCGSHLLLLWPVKDW